MARLKKSEYVKNLSGVVAASSFVALTQMLTRDDFKTSQLIGMAFLIVSMTVAAHLYLEPYAYRFDNSRFDRETEGFLKLQFWSVYGTFITFLTGLTILFFAANPMLLWAGIPTLVFVTLVLYNRLERVEKLDARDEMNLKEHGFTLNWHFYKGQKVQLTREGNHLLFTPTKSDGSLTSQVPKTMSNRDEAKWYLLAAELLGYETGGPRSPSPNEMNLDEIREYIFVNYQKIPDDLVDL